MNSSITLSGVTLPRLGFGTWQLTDEEAPDLVAKALEVGYRHIDTAQIYKNERGVGEGLARSGLARDEIFLTTKVWVDRFHDGDLQASVRESLDRLAVEQVDLLLLHWPKPNPPFAETLGALNNVLERGWTRSIGLSNFPVAQWRQAQSLSPAKLVTNQVEYHPYLSQNRLLAAAAELGSSLTAWSPLAQGKIAEDKMIGEIAARHGKTAGQVVIRWLLQQEPVIVIPRTRTPTRIAENFAVFDFELSTADMAAIHGVAKLGGAGRLGPWIDAAFSFDPE
ncbi:MAG: 2,5-diketo-D-gluconic acid reductase [Caulobacteraceae bacterium]|nr:2,5-diketo-D-gluconic acid reductase [Caulobacteraceae bacterium]